MGLRRVALRAMLETGMNTISLETIKKKKDYQVLCAPPNPHFGMVAIMSTCVHASKLKL